MTPPWSTSPDDPESPEIGANNVVGDEEIVPPWKTMVNSSCVGFVNGPDADCKKEGV